MIYNDQNKITMLIDAIQNDVPYTWGNIEQDLVDALLECKELKLRNSFECDYDMRPAAHWTDAPKEGELFVVALETNPDQAVRKFALCERNDQGEIGLFEVFTNKAIDYSRITMFCKINIDCMDMIVWGNG